MSTKIFRAMQRPRGPAVAETPRRITGRSAGRNDDPAYAARGTDSSLTRRRDAANLVRSRPARPAKACSALERILSPPDLERREHAAQRRALARRGGQSLFRAFAQVACFPAFPNTPRESSHVSPRGVHAGCAHREGTVSCPGHVGHRPRPFTRSPKLIPIMIAGPILWPKFRKWRRKKSSSRVHRQC